MPLTAPQLDTKTNREALMTGLALMLSPITHGRAVSLTNGRALVRFHGPGARWRARHYLTRLRGAKVSRAR